MFTPLPSDMDLETMGLDSPFTRHLLSLDFPDLPSELLQADALTLAMIAEAWYSSEERTARLRQHHEPHRGSRS